MIMEGFGFYAIKLDMEIPKGDALEVFDSGLEIFLFNSIPLHLRFCNRFLNGAFCI